MLPAIGNGPSTTSRAGRSYPGMLFGPVEVLQVTPTVFYADLQETRRSRPEIARPEDFRMEAGGADRGDGA